MDIGNRDSIREKKLIQIQEINELLSKDVNIISYLTDSHKNHTSVEDELISYDLRAGKDIEAYKKDSTLYRAVADKLFNYMLEFGCDNGRIIECGAGEGIVLSEICSKNNCGFTWARGIDISWSRSAYAHKNLFAFDLKNIDIDFIVGDFFRLPIKNNAIDVVYTMQGIYGMGGYEEELLRELYRVTKRLLILVEPCYEMAEEDARKRMVRLGYVKGLKETAENLGYKIVKYELFGLDSNPLNPAAALIIKKDARNSMDLNNPICCPYTYTELTRVGNALFSDSSKLSYPILNDVMCLTRENAIVSSQMKNIMKD